MNTPLRPPVTWMPWLALLLSACSSWSPLPALTLDEARTRLDRLLPADALLVGEQHDAKEHQRMEQLVTQALIERRELAALALEMSEQGRSTAGLPVDASEDRVREALGWSSQAWPWEAYGPAIMTAVRAGVPVHGANLPRSQMRASMQEAALDQVLNAQGLKEQQDAVREGHCHMLPESQIAPMTRIQLARDRAMAQTLLSLRQNGKTVLLLAGGGHVRRDIGVPAHLGTQLRSSVLLARAGAADGAAGPEVDMVWPTPALPPKDYCAELQRKPPPKGGG